MDGNSLFLLDNVAKDSLRSVGVSRVRLTGTSTCLTGEAREAPVPRNKPSTSYKINFLQGST
jgi:hypothetical protein